MKTALAFPRKAAPPDYGRRLSRLRWIRAFPAEAVFEISDEASAHETFSQADVWIVVRDETALPVASPRLPDPVSGRVLVSETRLSLDPADPHTLREFESASPGPVEGSRRNFSGWPAICFRVADFRFVPGETVARFIGRLLGLSELYARDSSFRAFAFVDPSERVRPELTRHIPRDAARLLDIGCGAGGTSAALKAENRTLSVTGIERDPEAAGRARRRLNRVLEANAAAALESLASADELYDAFLFADILEHLEDPIRVLALARALAAPGATLVASVPNVGHLSIVRDLLLGRFDPIPAGLADVGHLRWFTRSFLAEALEEAGWRVMSIESVGGAPASCADEFLARLVGWPGLDRESLATYQWIAVAAPA